MMDNDVVNDREMKRELVCALADGQLRSHEFAKAVEFVNLDADCRAVWQSYHVIGDVLRSPELAAIDSDFLARFQSRLASDADSHAADRWKSPVVGSNGVLNISSGRRASANDSAIVWKITAGCASLAAAVALGWSMAGGWDGRSNGPELAQAVSPVQASATPSSTLGAASESAIMIRDSNLDALLAAHKQFGGATALQMPTGVLRNATFEGAAR